jgi:hypothetical protein
MRRREFIARLGAAGTYRCHSCWHAQFPRREPVAAGTTRIGCSAGSSSGTPAVWSAGSSSGTAGIGFGDNTCSNTGIVLCACCGAKAVIDMDATLDLRSLSAAFRITPERRDSHLRTGAAAAPTGPDRAAYRASIAVQRERSERWNRLIQERRR